MKRLVIVVLMVAGLVSIGTAQVPKKYALIVGISTYKIPQIKLDFAADDANNFYDLLRSGYLGKFDTIQKFINEEAKFAEVLTALKIWLEEVRDKMEEGDELYIYWAGHGNVAKKAHKLFCQNTEFIDQANNPLKFGMSFNELKEAVKTVTSKPGVRVYLIVDACRNNEVADEIDQEVIDKAEENYPGEIYLYACSNNQFSFETRQLDPGSGVFTYFLLMGLKGGADNNPRNGKVTVGEMESFLHEMVDLYVTRKLTIHPDTPLTQRPKVSISASRNIVISEPHPDTAGEYRARAERMRRDLNQTGAIQQRVPEVAGTRGISANALLHQSGLSVMHPGTPAGDREAGGAVKTGDDTSAIIYNKFLDAISNDQLVVPQSASALHYYRQLRKIAPKGDHALTARQKLFLALLSKSEVLLENYLSGQLADARKEVFGVAYVELQAVLEIVPGDTLLREMVEPKMDFFRARELAGSNNPRQWNDGITLISAAIRKFPTAAYLYHTKGILFSNKGRFFTARRNFDTASMYAPNWTYALYSLATTNFNIQEYGKSIELCKKIIAKDSLYSKAYSLIGLNLEAISDYKKIRSYEDCIYWYNKALELDSSNVGAYFYLGRVYSKHLTDRLLNLQRSKKYYYIGASRYSDVGCIAMLGTTYLEQGYKYYDSATYYFDSALRMNPYHILTLDNYAKLLDYKGLRLRADSLLENAVRASGYDYNIYSKYRAYRFKNVSTKDADRIFNEIINMNSEDPRVFLDHSKQYEGKDSLMKARDILYMGISRIQESPSLNYALAELYFNHCRSTLFRDFALDSCLFYLNYVNSLNPDYSLVNFAKYQLYTFQNDDSARYYLTSAQQLNPYINYTKNFYKQILLKGDTLQSEGKLRQALEYFYLADSLGNNRVESKLKIARCYYVLGQLDTAQFYVREAGKYDSTREDNLMRTELAALIEFDRITRFDQRKYENVLQMFQDIDRKKDNPDKLGQVVCLFKLRRWRNATDVFVEGQKLSNNAVDRMMNVRGVYYSNNFLFELDRALNAVQGPSYDPSIKRIW